jgi:hypothetical protein
MIVPPPPNHDHDPNCFDSTAESRTSQESISRSRYDLDAPAQEIADLYKQRWQIELFFRWVKQTLRIKRFIGVSENAVRIQIAVALIAFLLLRLAQATQKAVHSPLEFARLIRANLMHRRPIDRLLEPLQPVEINAKQLKLGLYFQ